jgi:hypothetical protein
MTLVHVWFSSYIGYRLKSLLIYHVDDTTHETAFEQVPTLRITSKICSQIFQLVSINLCSTGISTFPTNSLVSES